MSEQEQEDKSWYSKGYDGVKDEEERLASSRGPQRFWMPGGEKKEGVFIDGALDDADSPFCIYEYNPKINGSWKNWFTDPSEMYPDDTTVQDILKGKYNRYYVGYHTFMDSSKWKTKQGKVFQFELKLFPAKIKSLKLLQSKAEDWDGLQGKVVKIRRTSSEDASCGNDFEKLREADLEKLWKIVTYQGRNISEWFEAAKDNEEERAKLVRVFNFRKGDGGMLIPEVPTFNYFEILKPKTPKELRRFLAGVTIDDDDDNSSSGGSAGEADEKVPF